MTFRSRYPGIEQLICFALAKQDFARQLLVDPAVALETTAHIIKLSSTEYELVATINGAVDIHDFAARLHAKMQQLELTAAVTVSE